MRVLKALTVAVMSLIMKAQLNGNIEPYSREEAKTVKEIIDGASYR